MNLENLKQFKLSREQLSQISGSRTIYTCSRIGSDGKEHFFSTENAALASSWEGMWGYGAHAGCSAMDIHEI